MKNKGKILIVLTILLLLTGCSDKRTALDSNNFLAISNSYNYTPTNVTENYDYANGAYVIKESGIYVFYIEGKDKYAIQGTFLDQCINIYKLAGIAEETTTSADDDSPINTTTTTTIAYKKTLKGGEGWQYLKVTTDDKFYYASWIDKTYIYIEADASKTKDMEKFIDSLGY